ncbi:hypothetical protein [Plebeiibacterium sediminum]|uniref:Uncharacterized protein n=1 Tax=Plebeiibacterium sediminum TaxID=2992112 RepID=A0AAE3MAB5_9BACT|nr:hypothetical protein [Plebeiobacterium sediminum]MCW3789744.1 hypothetical protein [Plebeiobacterium sediminum]
MLALIHTISDNIIFRKSLKWTNLSVDKEETFDSTNIYVQMESFMNKYLNKLSCNKAKPNLIEKCLRNLLSVKNSMDETPWSIPCHINDNEKSIFLRDLDFYLMISGVLLKSCALFKGFIPKHHCPPISAMLPSFASNKKRVLQAINCLNSSKWKQTVTLYMQNSQYLKALDDIQIHLRKPNYNQELSQLQQLLLHTFSVLPETQIDEYYKTIAINELNKHFKSLKAIPKQISNIEWKAIRCIITVLIQYSADAEPIVSIYHNIREGLIKNSDFNVKAEIQFFKKQIQYINKLTHKKVKINPLALNICTDILEDLNFLKTNAKPGQIQEAYLEWRHTPKVFVSYLQSAIANGYITLKGNADMKPIIEFISTFH